MDALLVDIKSESEKKVLLAFLKSLKITYKKITPAQEDKALLRAMTKGKLQGRATQKQQREFETWLRSR
jgi:hypothetical protein